MKARGKDAAHAGGPPRDLAALRARSLDVGLLILRLGSLAMIAAYHVRPKLLHFREELATFPDPLGLGHAPSFILALLSEGICSVMVAAGLLTRLSCLPILFTMGMVLVLGARGFAGADTQAALLYALPYLTLVFTGPGSHSLDSRLQGFYERHFHRFL